MVRHLYNIAAADLAALRGDSAAAEEVYREALALPAIGEPLRREVAWRLALLRNTRGEFAEALRGLDSSFDCDSWTAEALASRAISYRNLGARAFGIEKIYEDLVAAEPPKGVEGPDVVPIFRANPSYPQEAMRRGLGRRRPYAVDGG